MGNAMMPEEWERQFGAVWGELRRTLDLASASTAVILDTSGNPVTYSGEDPNFDLGAFSSLAVGDFLASREMAAVLQEEDLRWVVHQGRKGGVILAPLHPNLILAVLFDGRTTLGLVRHQLRRDYDRLQAVTQPLLRLIADRRDPADSEDSPPGGGRDWIGEGLEQLFGPMA